MDEEALSSTSPFYTLDAFNGQWASHLVTAVEEAQDGNTSTWENYIAQHDDVAQRIKSQGIKEPRSYETIQWDAATLLFTVCVEITDDGRPLPLGDRLNRERFGRFPYGNGSALSYLLEYIRPNRSITDNDGQDIYDSIIDDLQMLSGGCTEEFRGHTMFESGFGGMNIQGYLSREQVRTLRKNLASRTWTASYEEPLDGGVADVAKHFIALLKAAERRQVGVVLRSHS
ncbi:MAG: hypothetical protein ISR24_03325 [Candidatus Poseidonia sp.]|uniref:Uncharacterized protein n=1 Tax=uncultured archaeon MedDCM-OCT-S06-C18 TaxID=743094 RepID=D6PBS0_9ARCH|nr:unknown protein [uncultured archaeon MedDCM-OCT-S06-C18]MBL6886425.1 hypothetical protein [Poseidonia sp.]MBL6891954.1 hypothetical protein [Poseidonia sp.]